MFPFNGARKKGSAKLLQRAGDAMRARDWPEAALLYAEGLATQPNDVGAWVQYGHALKEAGDRRQAEEAYRRALTLDPDLPDTHLQLGHVLKLQGRFDEAAESYAQALSMAPVFANAARELTLLGWSPSRIQRLRHNTARRELRTAVNGAATATVLFDVSDLIQYFQKARAPTGIQRVQISSISSILQQDRRVAENVIVCFTERHDFWIEIPPYLFQELTALALSGGSPAERVWQDALGELNASLELGVPYEFRGGETLINIGTSWWLTNYFLMVRLAKVQYGVKYIPFIHDLIPIVTPEHCTKELTQDFISWIVGVFFHANGYLVNSLSTAADLKKVAGLLGHTISEPRVVRLDGCFHPAPSGNRSTGKAASSARADIPGGPFVLFVGTIESRKNHLLAFDVWLELIRRRGESATPTLVCIGNEGWMVEAAMSRLNASDQLRRRVRIIKRVSDGELTSLYRDCLFTIYPSAYEGWGLPVTEALSFGKMVVTTSVSSLPEVGGDLVDYFDLLSPADMLEKIGRLIDDADYRHAREARIRAKFQARGWSAIGAEIVEHAVTLSEPLRLPELGKHPHWVLPLPAQACRYYSLGRNRQTSIWPGMVGGEMYRMGSGWRAPDDLGTWTKPGLARLAFRPPPQAGALVLYLGLLAPSGDGARYRLRLLGGEARARSGELGPGETRWAALTVPCQELPDCLIHLGIEAVGMAKPPRAAEGEQRGVCVRGFYFCREDDFAARLRFLEALQMHRLEDITGQPEELLDDFANHEFLPQPSETDR
jgi:glycosyltransferase involved in cell wall biosynthesis